MKFSVLIALVLCGLAVLFSVQNSQIVQVSFFRYYFEASLVVVLLLTLAIGIFSSWLLAIPGKFRTSRELSECRSRIAELERAVADARIKTAPPAGEHREPSQTI